MSDREIAERFTIVRLAVLPYSEAEPPQPANVLPHGVRVWVSRRWACGGQPRGAL